MAIRLKKLAVAFALLFTVVLPLAAAPTTARAEGTTIVDLPRIGEWIGKVWNDYVKNALIQGSATILINTMTYAADRLAYDAAVYISSGGAGDDPLFDNRNAGEYFSDYGAAVAGEFIGQIDESGLLGNFKICDPSLDVTIAFKFGLKSAFEREEPECDIKEVGANWEGFVADIATTLDGSEAKTAAVLTALADMYNPQTNDFSVGIQLYTSALAQSQQQASLEAQKNLLLNGFKDKTDFLTGKVQTPGKLLEDNLKNNLNKPQESREDVGKLILSSSDNILLQMGVHAGSVFANTLISKGMQRLYDGLFGNLDQVAIDPFNEISYSSPTAQDARDSFSSFLAAAPLEVTNYSVLKDFVSCPSVGRGLYNCVADASFISAVARADSGSTMTVQEALDEGLLHGSWPLIPSADQARDQDQYCYTYGYCHSNIVKLRKARVISDGWELAAESIYNSASSPATLGEVVAGFNNCGSTGQPTKENPWCHLIDPDWVLKYPETQCRQQVYGQLLSNPSTDQRAQECVDMPSCIDENDDGTCSGGYGYCVREENVWRFRGESCPEYSSSCTSYEDSDGENVAYLANTVDEADCTESSAGCLWYSTVKDDESGTFDWPTVDDVAVADAQTDAYAERIYFTSMVEECEAEDAGCRELVERDENLSLNMITNPSFEDDTDEDGMPDGWFAGVFGFFTSYLPEFDTESAYSLSGTNAISPGDATAVGAVNQAGIVLRQSTTYTLSFYARQTATSADDVSVYLLLDENRDEDGNGSLDDMDITGTEVSGDCDTSYTDVFGNTKTDGYGIEKVTPEGTDYERYSCTFAIPSLDDSSVDVIGTLIALATDVYIDDIQLEQDAEASSYHEGYSDSTLSLAYVKTPPDYLGCSGEDSDPDECDGYAAMCEEKDVGCSEYTPTNGDPAVIGVASAVDACPSTCVGYDTFKQEATLYEPEGSFPVYFIPDSATECSEEAVGCDEFTSEADESLNYFTYLRACVTESQADANISGDQAAVFYTWEGSDLDGYQLKTWNLLESDLGVLAYTYAESGEQDANPGAAPCTNWITTTDGIACDDDGDGTSGTTGSPITDNGDCDEHGDVLTNPDCREFYDASGDIHYREWSATVTVDNACVTYRKSSIVGSDATEQQANCEGSGGYFDTATAICRYYGFADESTTCEEADSGCREYTGGRSRNSRMAFTEYFEDDTLASWDASSAADVSISNESIATDGHSLLSSGEPVWTFVATDSACTDTAGCAGTEGDLGGSCTIAYGETSCGTLDSDLFDGKTYTVSFWAKGTGTIAVGFDIAASPSSVSSSSLDEVFDGAVSLEEGWNEYTLGPLAIDDEAFGSGTVLVFAPDSGVAFYLDNVVLREGEDNITVIKNSWETPSACDETPEGTASSQYYLGCSEYTDQDGDTSYLKSFSSLCSEDQIGCASYFMTQESDSTNAQVFGAVCKNDADGDNNAEVVTSATDCYWGTSGGTFDTASRFLCTIGVGNNQCEFDMEFYVPQSDLPDHVTYDASTAVVAADREVFLVVNDDVECSSDVAGCQEVGLPTFSQDHTAVDSWTSTYLMNDPDAYGETLCSTTELFCEAWTETNGDMAYFKSPQDQTCEYKTDVTISGTTYDGWFKTGTSELCYDDYVIGGDVGGIWRNGDDDYDGWVGTCSEKYDGCSEFQDLTDLTQEELYATADGEPYYYLDNDNLGDDSLPDSQKCNDQVSQKDGCGLFNDATEPSTTFATSPSYILSIHADDLLGESPNGLVDPVDCESGADASTFEGTDLCESRCAYVEGDLYDLSNGSSTDYVYDGSCYVDDDCRPLLSEVGETVEGSCLAAGSANRIENDANRVLKVDRDRECSEWLSCSDTTTTWDQRTNSFKTICNDIDLCTEYSTAGNSSFCSDWKFDDVETVLDQEKYTTRDTSWYGDDYSGYAVPNTFPVQTLTQVNVSAPSGYCNMLDDYLLGNVSDADWEAYQGAACTDDTDCSSSGTADTGYCVLEEEEDFRLAFVAGSCDEAYGNSCSVGYCSDSGAACVDSGDCSSDASCLVGACYEVSSSEYCEVDADCTGTDQTCFFGTCAVDRGEITIEGGSSACSALQVDSSTDMTLSYADAAKTGSCMREQCILTPSGSTFNTSDAETVACRAYPELNSPYPTEVVQEWTQITTERTVTSDPEYGAQPWSYRNGFAAAQTCVSGEDCDCSYKKITYGPGGTFKYFDQETVFPLDATTVGICSGGTWDGVFCSTDSLYYDETAAGSSSYAGSIINATSTCEGGGGSCIYPTKSDNVLGLEGYCLERDSGTSILGDRDQHACITWLPVDQLAGSSDLYAKYTSAGYFDDTEYCASVGLFGDVSASTAKPGTSYMFVDGAEMLCAEASDLDISIDPYCDESVKCAAGMYAVLGPRYDASDAEFTTEQYSYTCSTGGGIDIDCPFVCVPIGAKLGGDGAACDVGGVPDDLGEATPVTISGDPSDTLSGWETPKYLIDDPQEFTDYVNAAQSCEVYGRQMNDGTNDLAVNPTYYRWSDGSRPSENSSYGAQGSSVNLFVGCKQTAAVINGEFTDAAPFTDRILNEENYENTQASYALSVGDAYPQFGYKPTSARTVFGRTIATSAMREPPVVGACYTSDDTGDIKNYEFFAPNLDLTCTSSTEDKNNHGVSFSNPESRAFTDFHIEASRYEDESGLTSGSAGVGGVTSFVSESYYQVGNDTPLDPGDADDGTGWLYLVNHLFAFSPGGNEYSDGVYDNDAADYLDTDDVTHGSYTFSTGDSLDWDNRDEGVAPSVYALDLDHCANDKCEEDAAHPLTLGDQNTGDVDATDFYRAYLKFYAAAYKEQLPIRRVIVDWQDKMNSTDDQIGSPSANNFYKNHRGLVNNTENSICDVDSADAGYEWGMNGDSCDPYYFTYSHIYACTSEILSDAPTCADADADGNLDASPCQNSHETCSFQPRVHVRDNWGLCTGTCDSADPTVNTDGEDTCVDNDAGIASSDDDDECDYAEYPDADSSTDPWVYYDGAITVTP